MSADYLQMSELLTYSVDFIVQNLNLVIEKGEQVQGYKSHIAKKIAKKITMEQLDSTRDPTDLIFSRLYKKKLEIFFEDQCNLLY